MVYGSKLKSGYSQRWAAAILLTSIAGVLSAQTDAFRIGVNYTAAWKNGSTSRLYLNDAQEAGANTAYLLSAKLGSVEAVKAALDSAADCA